MKRAIIVHCWGGTPDYAWYQSVSKHIADKGYEVTVLAMPDTENPRRDSWVPYLAECIGQPDEELILIGHSIGTVTILRYLETLQENQRINKAILVAGFTDQLGFKELDNFFETPLDYQSISKKCVNGFVAIQSDNDPFVSKQYGTRLQEELGAKLIIKHAAGHMSGSIDNEDSCTELPEVVESI